MTKKYIHSFSLNFEHHSDLEGSTGAQQALIQYEAQQRLKHLIHQGEIRLEWWGTEEATEKSL